MVVKNAEAQYKMDKDACSSRSGNAKDICLAEATGKEKIAKADAEAAYKNTPKAREDARATRAEATYNVAKEKCDELSGNPKDVCVKEADAALVKAKADAKVDRVAADTQQDAAAKQADARKEANRESATRITRSQSRSATHSQAPRRIRASATRRCNTASPEIDASVPRRSLYGRREGSGIAAGVVFSLGRFFVRHG